MTDTTTSETQTLKRDYRWLRITGRIGLVILVLLIALIFFIRSEWGQEIITPKVASFLENKIGTKVIIEKLYITFDGAIKLDGLYIEDVKGDTLIYSREFEANIAFAPLISGTGFTLNNAKINGLRATVKRKDTLSGFNFDFISEAFASESSPTPEQKSAKEESPNFAIAIGNIDVSEIDIVYNDSVSGIISRYRVDRLEVVMDDVDIVTMRFTVKDALIKKAQIDIMQFAVPKDPNVAEASLPFLAFEKLRLEQVNGSLVSKDTGVDFRYAIGSLYTEIPSADLTTYNIAVDQFDLKNSQFDVKMTTMPSVPASSQTTTTLFPDYQLDLKNIRVAHTEVTYLVNEVNTSKGTSNSNAIALKDLKLNVPSIYLKDKQLGLIIKGLSGKEASGLDVKHLKGKIAFSDRALTVNNLSTEINNTTLKGAIAVHYPSLETITTKSASVQLDINIPTFSVDVNDAFLFKPSLKNNEYLTRVAQHTISGNVVASGSLDDVKLPSLNVYWGGNTKLTLSGLIKNTIDIDNLYIDMSSIEAKTTRTAISKFVTLDTLNIQLPQDIRLKGHLKGKLSDLSTKATLTTTQGVATLNGNLKNGKTIVFDAQLGIKDYNLGALLQHEKLGDLTINIKTSGSGTSLKTLNATADATVQSLSFNNYAIEDLHLGATIKDGAGDFISRYKDKHLNVELDGTLQLDSLNTQATAYLNVIGADLEALGLMQREVRTGFKMDARFKGNAKSYAVNAQVEDGVIVYDDRTYLLGTITTSASIRPDATSVQVTNKLMDLDLRSNKDPQVFTTDIIDHVRSYFYRDAVLLDTLTDPTRVILKGKIRQAPVLNEVFLVNMKDLDTISFDVDFAQGKKKLNAKITAPHINYAGNELDSLTFNLKSTRENFDFDLGFNALTAGPIAIKRTEITGRQRDKELTLEFLAFDDQKKLIHLASEITGNRDRLRFHILKDSLIFNKREWQALPTNEIIITDKKLEFNDFRFKRKNQLVEITDKISSLEKEHIAIDFQNFKLQEFLTYLNPDQKLATGNLNGDVVIVEPFGDFGFLADLTVDGLKVLNEDMGIAELSGRSVERDRYNFNFAVSEGVVDLILEGDYVASEEGANLAMNLDIATIKMEAIDGFSLGELTEGAGRVSGNFSLNGKLNDLDYKGELNFKDTGFLVTKLNTSFLLKNESVSIDNKGFTMSNFTVLDQKGSPFIVSGIIGTENIVNPTFDLDVTATAFQALDATKQDNELLYGKAIFDTKARITGDLDIPIIDLDVTISPKTDITYVMPTAQANLESSDGIVLFVNRENPEAILTRKEEETGALVGFDITSKLRVHKEAKVTIIIDQETGDNLKVQGEGDFSFSLEPNGRMNLTGIYNLADGKYEMNLYNLVNRTFTLDPNSQVKWSGDPFDAELDLRAIYSVETSAAPLMAAQVSGSEPSLQSQFRQQLPFLVYLNIDGQLMSPKINFALDLPEAVQGALGGEVYGRIQQVNQQEGELNRQVFSLLVLNRFYPQSGADGSGGGFASIARDNLNDALSDQLNVFSDKLLGNSGFQLDFGLDSYTDYQGNSPQERTQLDIAAQRNFFDNRLTVRVGSSIDVEGERPAQESGALIGNVSLEYGITEDGQYKLRGFRRNEFENVIDGQTIVSGISLIFQQEFNQFSQLWDAILRKKKKELEVQAAIKKESNPPATQEEEKEAIKNKQ